MSNDSAQFDQIKTGMRNTILVVKAHYDIALAAGFSEEHAIRLALDMQRTILAASNTTPD